MSRVKLKLIMHYCIPRFIACKSIAIAFGNQMCCIKAGLEIGHFWKNSNSRKLKTQAKNSNSSKKPSKTQAIKLNYEQFHSNYWISFGIKHKFANQNQSHFMPRCPIYLAQSLVFIWKTQAQNSISGKFIWSICRNLVQFLSLP